MKVLTPEISWHEREPIYSVDFQPGKRSIQRVASGGVDKIVRIWQMSLDVEGKVQVDFLSNLRRHTQTVNVVRFSRNGDLLASAGDDTTIILWKLNEVPAPANNIFSDDDTEEDKESWVCHKTLRGHLGDVVDLSWSRDNNYLVSGSIDNCAVVWDVTKGEKIALFKEHKSYVQGVAFDPLGMYVATMSADRSLRLYNLNSKQCIHNVSKMTAPSSALQHSPHADSPNPESKPKAFRIFHDDSLRSFFRRLEFSPDGQLLVAPAGCMELKDKVVNTAFIFARGAFSKPAVYLPSPEKSTVVVRANPQLFELRPADSCNNQNGTTTDQESEAGNNTKIWEKHKSLFCLPYRVVFAVATEDSVVFYDSQQAMPIGLLKNIHYQQITDLSWTSDGTTLIVSSADGFCTIVTFEDNELGIPYQEASVDGSKTHMTSSPLAKSCVNDEAGGQSPNLVASNKRSPTVTQTKGKMPKSQDTPSSTKKSLLAPQSKEQTAKSRDTASSVEISQLAPQLKEQTPKQVRKIEPGPAKMTDGKLSPPSSDISSESCEDNHAKTDSSCSSEAAGQKCDLLHHVSSINIADSMLVEAENTPEATETKIVTQGSNNKEKKEAGVMDIQMKKEEEKDDSKEMKDEPMEEDKDGKNENGKKKRIQFTTLSLIKK